MILSLLLAALLLAPAPQMIQKTPARDAFVRLARAASSIEGADVGFAPAHLVSQRGSGPFEEVNCMPAAAAMLLRWSASADETASPPDARVLRGLLPLDGAPWRPEHVHEILLAAGLTVDTPEISPESMTGALDAGRALLVLVQENGLGHCYLVTAYARTDEQTIFAIVDPADGLPRFIDSDALLRRMEGYWWRFLAVGKN